MSRVCSYTWKINDFQNYDTPTGESLQSPLFWVDEQFKWKIMLYPRGDNHDCEQYLCVFIVLASSPALSNISLKCQFCLFDVNKHIYSQRVLETNSLQRSRVGFGFHSFVCRRNLKHLPGGILNLYCKVAYNSPESKKIIALGQSSEYSKMLMNPAFSDVTFQIGKKKMPAHKVILAAKSPTFYQALELEKTGSITIVDVKAEVFEEMLCFIYTGTVKQLHVHAKDLIVAAEEYKIYDLRDICVNYFVRRLTVDNAIQMAQFARDCHCKALEDRVLKFINENFVRESPKYLVCQLTNVLKSPRQQ